MEEDEDTYNNQLDFNNLNVQSDNYSPRPELIQEEPTFKAAIGNNPLAGFQLKFDDDDEKNFSLDGLKLNNFNDSYDRVGNFSPRPSNGQVALDVNTPELAPIFNLVSQFQPPVLELSPHFKPFLPDLVPAIGSIDAFIKIPRPDDEIDLLGLKILDEPTIGCSDPQILKMQLREKYGIVSAEEGDGYIGCIANLGSNQKALDTFLESYEDINTNRPAPSMNYSHKMPELEDLMQLWPDELEKLFETLPLPSSEIDLSIEEFAKVICALLDIPVKGNLVESLHLLFSLYQHFRDNVHFNNSRGSTPIVTNSENPTVMYNV